MTVRGGKVRSLEELRKSLAEQELATEAELQEMDNAIATIRSRDLSAGFHMATATDLSS